MACASLSATMPWGISDENGLECRTEELGGEVLFCSWVVMAVSSWGAVSLSRCESSSAVGQCEWRRDTRAAPAAPGQGITWLTWEQELPSSEHWHPGKIACVHKMSSLLYSNYYMKMILSVVKAAETVPKSLVAQQEMPWCRWHACHSQSTDCPMPGHSQVLPGWRMLLSPLPGKVTAACRNHLPPAPPLTFPISLWKLFLSIF